MIRLASLCVAVLAVPAFAGVVQKPIAYEINKVPFEGVLIFDDAIKTPRPALLAVPNWLGITPANLKQVEGIAGTKYVIFVADPYGKTARPKGMEDAGKASGAVKGDRKLFRERMNKALEVLKTQKIAAIEAKKVGAIGFCFGGTGALELARSGAAISGVVAFHAGLDSPKPEDAKNIKGKILALQGADDPHVPQKDVDAFSTEMRAAKVDWELVQFGNTVHSYTDLDANQPGSAMYNEQSAKRAYALMNSFFDEVFAATN